MFIKKKKLIIKNLKLFSKREKKPDDIPAKRIVETSPAELTVPESEPFRRAFAVNGLKSEEVDSKSRTEKPTRYFEVAKVKWVCKEAAT